MSNEVRNMAVNRLVARWSLLVSDECITAYGMMNSLNEQISGEHDMSADDYDNEMAEIVGWGAELNDQQMDEWRSIVNDAANKWLSKQDSIEYLIRNWRDDIKNILNTIGRQDIKPMTFDEFLSHCTACGGNWGGMLLSGIKHFYPDVWDAVPDNMGRNAFFCIGTMLELLDIGSDEEE